MEFVSKKLPALVTVDETMYTQVVSPIQSENFLNFKDAQNEDLFIFAMAVGWKAKMDPKMAKRHASGFVRTSYFSPQLCALIDAVHFRVLGYDSPDGLCNHDESCRIAERYVNGGLHILQGELDRNTSTEEYANELIAEMNDLYSEWFVK